MKRGLLAAAFLLTSAGVASADYIIIVANVGGKELKTPGAGMMGGMRGGTMGTGGSPYGTGTQGGSPYGTGTQGGSPYGTGTQGGSPYGTGTQGGSPYGTGTQGGSPYGTGTQGGSPSGMGGMRGGGMRGGMRGGMMGMRGGMMGMMGGIAGATDADDLPYLVLAVVEVKPSIKNMPEHFHKLTEQLKQLGPSEQLLQLLPPVKVALPEHLGKACYLLKKPSFGEMFIITEGKNKPIPTLLQRYKDEHEKTMKGTPSAGGILHLAEWSLEHGLLDKFQEAMNKLVEVDKTNPAGLAYQKVKADLDRPASDDPSVASWQRKLLPQYKVTSTAHYLLVNKAKEAEIKTHAEHLENAFRSFYYWFALRKIPLSVPPHRLVTILTTDKGDFDRLHKILTSGPVVVDGFYARRENLGVMTAQRQDERYEALRTYWKTQEDKGFNRHKLLEGKNGKPDKSAMPQTAQLNDLAEAQMLALMLKALEHEGELATASHDASRQLLFASHLLPHNVAVPEWLLFGMGSFFETPLESPWPMVGAPSPYYLPRWRELRNKGLEKTKLDTLRKTVTDGYFRSVPPDGKADSAEHRLHESELRKARTVSWALTYYLAKEKLDGLRRYFAELSKMPRDIELDDAVLLGCFARAFGCVDSNNKVNEAELQKLAEDWHSSWQRVNFDSESTMKEIRDTLAKKLKAAQDRAQQRQNNGNGGQPGRPGGYPGGPGGGPYPPGNPGGSPYGPGIGGSGPNPRPGGN